jgi:hypothetical protein
MGRHTRRTVKEMEARFAIRLTIVDPDDGWGFERTRMFEHWLKERTGGDYYTSRPVWPPAVKHIYFSDPRVIDDLLKRFQYLRLFEDPKAGSGAEPRRDRRGNVSIGGWKDL